MKIQSVSGNTYFCNGMHIRISTYHKHDMSCLFNQSINLHGSVELLVPCLSQPDISMLSYYVPVSSSHAVLCHTSWLYCQSICTSAFLALSCFLCGLAWSAWSVSHPSCDRCDQTGSGYIFDLLYYCLSCFYMTPHFLISHMVEPFYL